MAADNSVTLVGNLTDDPELRFTPSGQAVASFRIAVNRRFKNNEGQWEDRLDGFFRCSCWRDLAENVAESLQKGTRVVVIGRLQQRSWETQEGRRYDIDIQVDEVGPSLRFATAQVTKSQRSGGDWAQGRQSPASRGPGGSSDWGRQPEADWASSPAPVGGAPGEEEGGF